MLTGQMTCQDYHDIRNDYTAPPLIELEMAVDPRIQLELWLDEAIHTNAILNPTAAILSTVSKDGMPSARVVLIKAITDKGLSFYTDYNSQKGIELAHNPNVCLNFYWEAHHRQVRITGAVTTMDRQASDAYFHSRPHASQAAAAASQQSQPVEKADLQKQFIKFNNQTTIPCPSHWGGYWIKPNCFEFWQGQPNRLHDRIVYTPHPDKPTQWQKERRSP